MMVADENVPCSADFPELVCAGMGPPSAPIHVHHEALAVCLVLPTQHRQQGGKVVLVAEAVSPPAYPPV
jgi:hypothetical protein